MDTVPAYVDWRACTATSAGLADKKVRLKLPPLLLQAGPSVVDELYSAKPAQRSSHTGLPGYIGWTRFQPM
jgi:hypothetical protein